MKEGALHELPGGWVWTKLGEISWVKDESLADLDNLPDLDVLANEIIENVEAGLLDFREIVETINGE